MAEIRVSDESMEGWGSYKSHPGETVEEMVNRMLDWAEDGGSAERGLLDAREARKEFTGGRCVPHEEAGRRCGPRR